VDETSEKILMQEGTEEEKENTTIGRFVEKNFIG